MSRAEYSPVTGISKATAISITLTAVDWMTNQSCNRAAAFFKVCSGLVRGVDSSVSGVGCELGERSDMLFLRDGCAPATSGDEPWSAAQLKNSKSGSSSGGAPRL
jgi:hypothetical protein